MNQKTTTSYFEIRTSRMFGPSTPIASDIARHLQSRQYLGTTIVVCDCPLSLLSAVRKQWLKLSRTILKQRASTLNPEEILRYTHNIMHMQHLEFSASVPNDRYTAHIYFLTPDKLLSIPRNCTTIYITARPYASHIASWTKNMPADSLIVDYKGDLGVDKSGLHPKLELEKRALDEWADFKLFLKDLGIKPNKLISGAYIQNVAIDEALDKIQNCQHEFLKRAADFQHILCLAQPLTNNTADQAKQFEAIMRLAHRVQMLSPGAFNGYLSDTFGKSSASSFFLRNAEQESDPFLSDVGFRAIYIDDSL